MTRDETAQGEPHDPDQGRSEPAVAAPPSGLSSRLTGLRDGSRRTVTEPARDQNPRPAAELDLGSIIETIVSPFHCLYQDALHFHTQSRLSRSVAEAGRQARASFLLYIASAEALARQAARELAKGEPRTLLTDPARPLSLLDVWRTLPGIAAPNAPPRRHDPLTAPWPQFAELIALHQSWTNPGPNDERAAYYRSDGPGSDFEPVDHRSLPEPLAPLVDPSRLVFPRTGLPRDPYALRSRHLDTVRGVLDAAIDDLDLRMDGALTRGRRHRQEPVRMIYPPRPPSGS